MGHLNLGSLSEASSTNCFITQTSVGNRKGKSQLIIRKVKPIDHQLYNRISHNLHQIIDDYSIWAVCFGKT